MAEGLIWLSPVLFTANQADRLIKALPRPIFKLFCSALKVEQVDTVNTSISGINRS